MQAPGRPDEDRRGGFDHGGWATPYAAMERKDNPFTAVPNDVRKYGASRALKEPLPWMNSTLLKGDAKGGDADGVPKGDAAEAVARLKQESADDLVVLGSGDLIHPVVFGAGRRLFPDGASFRALRLVTTKTTTTGVVIATYQPAESEASSRHERAG